MWLGMRPCNRDNFGVLRFRIVWFWIKYYAYYYDYYRYHYHYHYHRHYHCNYHCHCHCHYHYHYHYHYKRRIRSLSVLQSISTVSRKNYDLTNLRIKMFFRLWLIRSGNFDIFCQGFKCYSDQIFTPWVFKLYLIEFHKSLKMPYVYECVYKKMYT